MAAIRNDVFQPLLDAPAAPLGSGVTGYGFANRLGPMRQYTSPTHNPRVDGTMNVSDAINSGQTVMPWAPSSGIGASPRIGSAAGIAGSKGTPTSARGRFGRLMQTGADVKIKADAEKAGRAAARKAAGLSPEGEAVAAQPVQPAVVAPKPAPPLNLSPSLLPNRQRGFDDALKPVRRVPSTLSRLYDLRMAGQSQRASEIPA